MKDGSRIPGDRTESIEDEIPAVDEDNREAEVREAFGESSSRETAIREKNAIEALTESRGWVMLREFVEGQKVARVNKLLLEPVTGDAQSLAEANRIRGEIGALMMVLKYVELTLAGATDALEVFKQQDRDDAGQ